MPYATAREMYEAWRQANPGATDTFAQWEASIRASCEVLARVFAPHRR